MKYVNSVGQEEGTAQKDLCGRGFCRHRASSANQKSRPPLIARSKNHEKSVWGFANFCFARDAKFPVVFSICSGRKCTRFPIHFSIVLSEKFQLRCFRSPPAVGGQVSIKTQPFRFRRMPGVVNLRVLGMVPFVEVHTQFHGFRSGLLRPRSGVFHSLAHMPSKPQPSTPRSGRASATVRSENREKNQYV